MINRILSGVDYLQKGLNASWMRDQVIANNIANEDTPGFKASYVEFEQYFKDALTDDDNSLRLTRTNSAHFDIAQKTSLSDVQPMILESEAGEMRMDGNNVDIDFEMNELAKNTILYNTMIQKYSKEIGRIRLAITESR